MIRHSSALEILHAPVRRFAVSVDSVVYIEEGEIGIGIDAVPVRVVDGVGNGTNRPRLSKVIIEYGPIRSRHDILEILGIVVVGSRARCIPLRSRVAAVLDWDTHFDGVRGGYADGMSIHSRHGGRDYAW